MASQAALRSLALRTISAMCELCPDAAAVDGEDADDEDSEDDGVGGMTGRDGRWGLNEALLSGASDVLLSVMPSERDAHVSARCTHSTTHTRSPLPGV